MLLDPVARVRRFNRAVTSEVGALDTSFLARGRPLGAARVLNAIGNRRTDVAEIRAYLDLDSGLMSRLLRGLEEEGLIRTVPHPDDARRRVAKLTAAGQREFQAYETLSNSRAETLLGRHSHPEALLAAMDVVASALGRGRITIEEMDPRGDEARCCLGEYYTELARRFQNGFDVSLSRDPEANDMIRPRGAFLVAMCGRLADRLCRTEGNRRRDRGNQKIVGGAVRSRVRSWPPSHRRRRERRAPPIHQDSSARYEPRPARGSPALSQHRMERDRPL